MEIYGITRMVDDTIFMIQWEVDVEISLFQWNMKYESELWIWIVNMESEWTYSWNSGNMHINIRGILVES